jgi:hypothetical protein
MTLSLAFLLIAILLIYDLMFLKMLSNRKHKILFSIYIEDGAIQSTEGKIADDFLSATKDLCRIYQPGKIKIMAIKDKQKAKLVFSGTLPEDFKNKLNNLWQNTL